ncbi:hypothetical protein WEI85_11030 [Actinomycetes bacterium KLBMP 9797]
MRITTRFARFTHRAIALAAVLTIAALAPAGVARAADGRELELPDFGDLVVDQAHRHLFVTGGPTSNAVLVTDFSGRTVKTLSGQHGATGLVLSADGLRLYVALAAGDAISVIDTKTLKETARYGTGAGTCPTHLARTEGLVWFGYGCDNSWSGGIGKLDTVASPPAVTLDAQGAEIQFQRAPLLAAVPDADGPLVAGQLELSLSTVYVYAVANGALSTQTSGTAPGSNLTDATLSPDGVTLFTASGSRNHVPGYATADLARRGAYDTGYYPNAVVASPNGRWLATGRHHADDDLLTWAVDGTSPLDSIDLTDEGVLVPRGLAWSGDSKQIFAVTQSPTGGAPSLHTVSAP